MDKPLELIIHIDGAARGNPGPAAFAYVMLHDGEPLLEESGTLGTATNNVAEYTALVKALEKAAELKASSVLIRSDSELLVRQMRGEYRVKNEKLLTLYHEANRLSRNLQSVRFSHVPREQNREADRLCNEALNAAASGRRPSNLSSISTGAVSRKAPGSETQARWRVTLVDAEQILKAAGLDDSAAREALQQILDLLHERGFLPHLDKSKH